MNMSNQKGFANIVLIVLVVILVGAVGYFALVKKSPTPTSENPPTNNLPTQQTPPTATNNPPATIPTTPSLSADKMKIGFTIESDTLTPDKVVGIFSRSANAVNLLGGYYLGNAFIGFSPNGTNFVYQGGCFEGMCGLYVKNSETLADKASLSDSESADARTRTATFVRWISDNEIEYKLGSELKQASF